MKNISEKRIRRIIGELEQLIRDTEWWNDNRLDCDPFDVGGDKCALFAARKYLECLEKKDGEGLTVWNGKLLEALDKTIEVNN